MIIFSLVLLSLAWSSTIAQDSSSVSNDNVPVNVSRSGETSVSQVARFMMIRFSAVDISGKGLINSFSRQENIRLYKSGERL